MRESFCKRLKDLETENQIRFLYACESGSRAWGFASPDSDYDVRFIYVRPIDQYLRLSPLRDVIELPLEDNLDISGWDLFKACRLLRRSNPPLLEWLGSPIVYEKDEQFLQQFRSLANKWFSRRAVCEYYCSQAKKNFTRYIEDQRLVAGKKYLYVLRPIMAIRWLLKRKTFPPTVFTETIEGIELPNDVLHEINELLARKKVAGEKDLAPVIPILSLYAAMSLEELPQQIKSIEPQYFPEEYLNQLLQSILLPEQYK